jgi:hypothetical protein
VAEYLRDEPRMRLNAPAREGKRILYLRIRRLVAPPRPDEGNECFQGLSTAIARRRSLG